MSLAKSKSATVEKSHCYEDFYSYKLSKNSVLFFLLFILFHFVNLWINALNTISKDCNFLFPKK